MSFSAVDIFFFLIFVIFIIRGTFKGFVGELFGKLSFIIGILCAILLNGIVGGFILKKISNPYAARIIAFFIVFALVFTVLKLIQKLLENLFDGEILASLDRALGFFLGAAEGIAAVALVIYLMSVQSFFDFDSLLKDSFFFKMLSPLIKFSLESIKNMPIIDAVPKIGGTDG